MKIFITAILLITTTINMQAKDSTVLKYLVREPKIKSDKTPVIILLHGVGSNENDLFSFADKLPDKYLVVSARAPITLSINSFAWYQVDFSKGKPVFNFQQEEESRTTLIKFISHIKEKYSANSNEIYLCGFSQGAIMSYSIALSRPDLVKGIAVMSGRLLEEIKPKLSSTEKLQQLKVFISHGKNDNVLPIHYSKDAMVFLKTLNINPTFKEYNAAHEINGDMLNDLINWLK